MEPGAVQSLRDRTALFACHSGDQNRSNRQMRCPVDGGVEGLWAINAALAEQGWNMHQQIINQTPYPMAAFLAVQDKPDGEYSRSGSNYISQAGI